jgi:hypothetical protein
MHLRPSAVDVIDEEDGMLEAEVVRALRDNFPSLGQFCGTCSHSRFVHADETPNPCFFDGCACSGWVRSGQGETNPLPRLSLVPA